MHMVERRSMTRGSTPRRIRTIRFDGFGTMRCRDVDSKLKRQTSRIAILGYSGT